MADDPVGVSRNLILWVEDEEDMESLVRQRLRKELREGTLEFRFANTLAAARILLGNFESCPLVICDVNLPDGSGHELLAEVRRRYGTLAIVIMATAYGDMPTIRAAMQAGAFDFLTKPLDFADVLATIARAFEFREIQKSLHEERHQMLRVEQEMDFARQIQSALLKAPIPATSSLISGHAELIPASHFAGICYDYAHLPDGRHLFAMIQVSGSGIGAAFCLVRVHTILHSLLSTIQIQNLTQFVGELNRNLCEQNEPGYFVSAFLSFISPAKGSLAWINAAHRSPMLVGADGKIRRLETRAGMGLGVKKDIAFQENVVQIPRGGTLVCYNHGLAECHKDKEHLFGDEGVEKSLVASLAENSDVRPKEICERLLKDVRNFVGDWKLNEDVAVSALGFGLPKA